MTRRWMICVLIELSMSMSGCNGVPSGLRYPMGPPGTGQSATAGAGGEPVGGWSLSVNDQSDYRRALDFEASLTALQACSERRAWQVAFAAAIVAIGSVAALAVMMPFYRVVPLLIEVNKLTGEVQLIEVLDAKHVPLREIEDKHWVEVYVRTRERYDWGLLQMDYDRVLEMSDESGARISSNLQRSECVGSATGRINTIPHPNSIDDARARRAGTCRRASGAHGAQERHRYR